MDDDSAIDFNAFPFQIRFTNNNKVYHECRALVEELGDVFYKMNTEIRDKLEIRNILREYFTYIGPALKSIIHFYNSIDCKIESDIEKREKRKQLEEKLFCYNEDEQESICFAKAKEGASVAVISLPSNWKSLTWQGTTKTVVVHSSSTHKLKEINIKEKDDDDDDPEQQRFQMVIEEVFNTIRTMNNQIQIMKNKICLLNENIIWLYSNFKEYLKVVAKFIRQFPSDETSFGSSPIIQSIKSDITKIFEIEMKLNFFSESPSAYKLPAGRKIVSFELIDSARELDNFKCNELNSPVIAPSLETKNLFALNYITEIYIDSSIIEPYTASSSAP